MGELSLSYDLEDEQEVSVARSNNSENDDVESSTTSESGSGKLDNKASSKSGESGKREHSTSRSSTAQVGQDMLARMQELESANQIDAKAKNPTVKGSSPRSGSGPFTPPPPRKRILVKSASSRTNRPPRIGALPSVSETEVATTGRPSIAVDGNGTDVFRVLVPDDCVRDRRESVLCAPPSLDLRKVNSAPAESSNPKPPIDGSNGSRDRSNTPKRIQRRVVQARRRIVVGSKVYCEETKVGRIWGLQYKRGDWGYVLDVKKQMCYVDIKSKTTGGTTLGFKNEQKERGKVWISMADLSLDRIDERRRLAQVIPPLQKISEQIDKVQETDAPRSCRDL